MRRSPRLTTLLLALLALVAGLAACGDDDSGSAADDTAAAEGDGAYPVEIEHAHGTTIIEARPERIVSLNVQWTDAALALGVEPVAYLLDAASGETEPYPWQAGRLGDAQRIDANGTIPFEQVAALRPDLILVTWAAEDVGVYESLSGIAPTIGLLGDLQVDPWEDQVEVLGRALGEEEQAAAVIAQVEAEVDALAEELPGLAGKTYVAANYIEGDGITVVADPEDGASRVFYRLGMEISPEILAVDEGAVGRVTLSLEQVHLLDADLLGILTHGSDPSRLPGWDGLRSVQLGSVVEFELADVIGLNTPTPLSIPYVLDLMRPALEKVAAA